jgi:hypothetical protein
MKVKRLNLLFADRLGRSPNGSPLYKWMRGEEYEHFRLKGTDMKVISHETGLIAPVPVYDRVEAYPHMVGRWTLGHWLPMDQRVHEDRLGNKFPFHKEGIYFPMLVMKEGKDPDLDTTEYFIQQVRAEREKGADQAEAEVDAMLERSDKNVWNTLYSIIDDATTAFGINPGTRSGGVSLPSAESNRSHVWQNE